MPTIDSSETLVLVSQQNGLVIIPASTLLTRLNYFDGKFLRATDLKTEQEYLRQLVEQSNQAAGSGVARGFDLTLGTGDTLNIGAGLAIDPAGRVLLLPQSVTVSTQDLIEKSRELQANLARTISAGGAFETCESTSTTRPANLLAASELYLIVLSHAEALCGEEDVFGKLCEEACATSTDRPFLIEGVIVRAIPLVLVTPLPTWTAIPLTATHLRSRVASAYFEDERRVIASLISRAGLALQTWCLGANPAAASGVPIGVLARAASTTVFIDAWTARRELINTGAERYWRWRMMMRPWDVFLAQVLQFQCQLRDMFRSTPIPVGDVDPCGGALGAVNEAATAVTELQQFYLATTQRFAELNVTDASTFTGGSSRLASLGNRLAGVSQSLAAAPRDSVLIDGGIIELPSAGYLPVVPGAGATINQQVRQLMGDGVDLRFCVVRPDYVAHALEEAQHMERISLVYGLDHPADKPKVDILVPDGTILEVARTGLRNGFETELTLLPPLNGLLNPTLTGARAIGQDPIVDQAPLIFNGVTRLAVLPSGGGAVYSAGFIPARQFTFNQFSVSEIAVGAARSIGDVSVLPSFGPSYGYWLSFSSEKNVFAMSQNEVSSVAGRAIIAERTSLGSFFVDVRVVGEFRVTSPGASAVTGQLSVVGIATLKNGAAPASTKAKPFNLTTRVVLSSPSAGGSRVDVTVQGVSGADVFFNAEWGKDPITAFGGITTQGTTTNASTSTNSNSTARSTISASTIAVTSELHPNADVYQVTNARHGQAISGLQVVGSALADSGFVNTASNLLFPPLPPASNELIVRGTRDWVLFHRRRTRQCSVEVKAPPMAPPRQYSVWHYGLIDDNTLNTQLEDVKAFLNGAGDFSPFFVKVADVEFQGGVAALISDPGSIRTDWSARNPGPKLVYGAIASDTAAAAEGDDLGLSRLAQIETVVSSISVPTATLLLELLPEIPRPPIAAGPDGAIVLITAKPALAPLTVCHTVARLKPSATIESFKKDTHTTTDFQTLFNNVVDLSGEVLFDQGTDTVAGDSLTPVANTLKAKGGTPINAVVVSLFGDSANAGTYAAQAAIIMNALKPAGTVAITAAQFPIQATSLVGCPAITVVEFFSQPLPPGACITPSEVTILAVQTPGGTGGSGTGLVRITNSFAFDIKIRDVVVHDPFSVQPPVTDMTVAQGSSLDVNVKYVRTAKDPSFEDRGALAISATALTGNNVNVIVCPPTTLIGQLRPSILIETGPPQDLVNDKAAKAEPAQSKEDAAVKNESKIEIKTASPAKPATRRKRKK